MRKVPRVAVLPLFALVAAAVAGLVGCNDFVFRTLMEGEKGAAWAGALQISPPAITLVQGSSVTFTAKGGAGSYQYAIVTAVGGSTIGASSGAYTASATTTGTETVRVTDGLGATSEAAVIIQSSAVANVNYGVTSVGHGSGTTAGQPVTGTFVYANGGADSGTVNVSWTVYASADTSLGGDYVVATGTASWLAAGASSASMPFGGSWPTTPGSYYLLVQISSSEEVDNGDNVGWTGPVVVVGPPPPDVKYAVSGLTHLSGTTAGAGLTGSFTVTNSGAAVGSATIFWFVYTSADALYQVTDPVVATGTVAGATIAAGGGSASPAFSGFWPASPGSYYLIVRASAADDTTAGDDQGVTGVIAVTLPNVNYAVSNVTAVAGTAGGLVSGSFDLDNVGTADGTKTVAWTAYASTNPTWDTGDTVIKTGTQGFMAAAPGPVPISLAGGTWPTTPGNYFVVVRISAADDVASGNDEASSAVPVTVAGGPPPDVKYAPSGVTHSSGTVAGAAVTGSFTITNSGSVVGSAIIYWSVYASTNTSYQATDPLVATGSVSGSSIAAGGGTTSPGFSGLWPATADSYYLIVLISAADDTSPGDNEARTAAAVAVTSPPPPNVDYAPSNVSGLPGIAGGPVSASFELDNVGTADGTKTVTWTAYASTNPTWDTGDTVIKTGTRAAMLSAPGPVLINDFTGGAWPTTPGNYFIVVRISASDDVSSLNDEASTASSVAVTAGAPPQVDYIVTGVTHSSGATIGGPVSGTFTFQNSGTGNGAQNVYWSVYASTDTTWDAADQIVDTDVYAGGLSSGGSTTPAFNGFWPAIPTSYYLIARVSAADEVDPADNEGRSAAAIAVSLPDVNYEVSNVQRFGSLRASAAFTGQFDLKNVGSANGTPGVNVSWTVYRSSDSTLTIGVDPVVDAGSHGPMASADPTDTIPFSGTWPSAPGNYWLFVRIAASDDTVPGNDTASLGPIAVAAPKVDYAVSNVQSTGLTIAGASLKGDFRLDNLAGSDDGTGSVLWTVYVSADPILTVGVDPVVASGMHAGLAAGTFATVSFQDGFWPMDPGTYYLIATATSVETDSNTGNNTASSPGVVTTGGPDYTVSAATFPTDGSPGGAFSGVRTFTIKNLTANTGNSPIHWRAYVSPDKALDASDWFSGAQGTVAALAGSASFVVNDLNGFNGTWAAKGGGYYLIVQLDADDDANPGNDLYVSTLIPVHNYTFAETEPNDDDKPFQAGFAGNDTGVTLQLDQAILITGALDNGATTIRDTFRFVVNPAVGHLEIYLTWTTGTPGDDADLELHWNDRTNIPWLSSSFGVGIEPTIPPWIMPTYAPNNTHAVAVRSWAVGAVIGAPYKLMITARP